jgi:hypothetical protein
MRGSVAFHTWPPPPALSRSYAWGPPPSCLNMNEDYVRQSMTDEVMLRHLK